ncbi:hypothetical protein ACL03H_18175 [Saccharopolyspora sp. MS10]|uniref:hypothetical protein n=1 Tax=Saccharopolyspora sp. MS10 TaxID=3385973 RepID=UPI0039A22F01
MDEQHRCARTEAHNEIAGDVRRSTQIGTISGPVTISGDAPAQARPLRLRSAVCTAGIAAALALLWPAAPAIAPPAAPAPEQREASSRSTGHGDAEISTRSGAPEGPSSGARCQGTGDAHCEVSSSITVGPRP